MSIDTPRGRIWPTAKPADRAPRRIGGDEPRDDRHRRRGCATQAASSGSSGRGRHSTITLPTVCTDTAPVRARIVSRIAVALVAFLSTGPHLDQLVRGQGPFDLADHRVGYAGVSDVHDRLERVRTALQMRAFLGGEMESHCR